MRQYQIHYKRLGGSFSVLEPGVQANLYERPEVDEAISLMASRPHLAAVAVILDDELFNVVSFNQDAEAPRAFKFETAESPLLEEVNDDASPQ